MTHQQEQEKPDQSSLQGEVSGQEHVEVLPEEPDLVSPTVFYEYEKEGQDSQEEEVSLPGALNGSHAMAASHLQFTGPQTYATHDQHTPSTPLPPARKRRSRRNLVLMICVGMGCLLIAGLLLVTVMAKPVMPAQPANSGAGLGMSRPSPAATHQQTAPTQQAQTAQGNGKPVTPQPTPRPTMSASPQVVLPNNTLPSQQVLQQLGWTTAGLTVADAIQADRTAVTFTDREESLAFDEPGTRTAAVFLLTPAGRSRFAQNDVRASSDALWNNVTDPARQLIQLAVNEQPTLVKQIAQGQNQFAWVDVQFELWRSQIDPQHANQRIGGLDIDPATNQPRMHHMIVLLLQVAPGSGGNNAPMGGTGWLVSNYALDPATGTLPNIVTPA